MFGKKKDGLQMGKTAPDGTAREAATEAPAPRVVQRSEPMTVVTRPTTGDQPRSTPTDAPRAVMSEAPRSAMSEMSRPGMGDPARPSVAEAPRRLSDSGGVLPRRMPEAKPAEPRPSEIRAAETKPLADSDKRLIVGREITLTGEIRTCDRLVVEGHVEASLADSRTMEISESGSLKGCAQVDTADVSGHLEGEITVRNRLTVRSTGRIIGTIRYGQLEIERGGVLIGTLEMIGDTAGVSGVTVPTAPTRATGRSANMEKSAAN